VTNVAVASATTRGRAIAYWLTTAVVAAELALGGVWDLLQIPYVRSIMTHLGYPPYFAFFMGLWKVPGALVLLVPGLPRLKEWAYAGMLFEMAGAVFSHFAVGDGISAAAVPGFLIALLFGSWALRPPDRRLC